jgi:hypothetical protein
LEEKPQVKANILIKHGVPCKENLVGFAADGARWRFEITLTFLKISGEKIYRNRNLWILLN